MSSETETGWPTGEQVRGYLALRHLTLPQTDAIDAEISDATNRAIRRVQKLVRKPFSITEETREYHGSNVEMLLVDWMTGIESVTIKGWGDLRPYQRVLDLTGLRPEWEALPHGGEAFRRITITAGTVWPQRDLVFITGSFGYSNGVPEDVSRAAIMFAASELGPICEGGEAGQISEWRGEGRDGEKYEAGTADHWSTWIHKGTVLLHPYIEPPLATLRRPHGEPWRKISVPFTTPN
jgi:hypothetical protein